MLDTHATAGTGPQSRTIIFDSISDDARVRHTHTHTLVSTPIEDYYMYIKITKRGHCVRHTHSCKHSQSKEKYEMFGHAQYLSKKSRSFVPALSSRFFGQV